MILFRYIDTIDGFHGTFYYGTGGHHVTMLPADCSIPHHMILLPSSFHGEKCYGIHLQ